MMRMMVMIGLLAVAACGKSEGSGGDATALCNKMWDRGTKLLREPSQENKPRYLERCTAMPMTYLRCAASGEMSAACSAEMKANRDGMMELSRILTGG